MKVLITGATGFLGGRLARLLCAEGFLVCTAGHPQDSRLVLEGLPVDHRPFDLLDPVATRQALEGVEAIFHAAALVTFQPRLYHRQWRVNVDGTRNLLEAAREAGVRRFVYTSTVNSLGIPEPGEDGDEQTPFDWGRFRLGYMDSKRAAEQIVLRSAAEGFDVVCVLPVTLFGPGDVNYSAGSYIRAAAKGLLLAAPPGGTTVAHADDVARGHLLAFQRGRRGERYILGGQAVTYRELFGWIAEELRVRRPILTLPSGPLKLAGKLSDLARQRLGLPIPFSEGLAVAACSPLFYSCAKAERELGYTHRPARQAVRDAVDWYRQKGWIRT